MKKVIFIVAIFISIWMGTINVAKMMKGESIPGGNFLLFAVGATGIVTHVLGLW